MTMARAVNEDELCVPWGEVALPQARGQIPVLVREWKWHGVSDQCERLILDSSDRDVVWAWLKLDPDLRGPTRFRTMSKTRGVSSMGVVWRRKAGSEAEWIDWLAG